MPCLFFIIPRVPIAICNFLKVPYKSFSSRTLIFGIEHEPTWLSLEEWFLLKIQSSLNPIINPGSILESIIFCGVHCLELLLVKPQEDKEHNVSRFCCLWVKSFPTNISSDIYNQLHMQSTIQAIICPCKIWANVPKFWQASLAFNSHLPADIMMVLNK